VRKQVAYLVATCACRKRANGDKGLRFSWSEEVHIHSYSAKQARSCLQCNDLKTLRLQHFAPQHINPSACAYPWLDTVADKIRHVNQGISSFMLLTSSA